MFLDMLRLCYHCVCGFGHVDAEFEAGVAKCVGWVSRTGSNGCGQSKDVGFCFLYVGYGAVDILLRLEQASLVLGLEEADCLLVGVGYLGWRFRGCRGGVGASKTDVDMLPEVEETFVGHCRDVVYITDSLFTFACARESR